LVDIKNIDKNTKYFGAIDLGSRNCRLLIAANNGSNLQTIATVSKMVGLGEGVARTSRLSKKAMDRAVAALSHCMKKVSQYDPIIFDAVATEACRKAVNQSLFLKRIKRELGIDVRVISYEEEARYVLLGCRQWIHPETKYALIFDIGGGSTELLWASLEHGLPGKLLDCVSIPYGVVSLSEAFKEDLGGKYSETCIAVEEIAQDFCNANNILEIAETSKVQMIGTSGTTTTVAAMRQNLRFYDRQKVEGTTLTFDDVQDVIKQLQLMRPEERLLHQCLGSNKDDLVLGGIAILDGIYRACPDLLLTVTDRGVRDGIVTNLIELDARKVAS
jgi:exopolyphosphatase/guanosine-5'-triphosphate,3'-diphosphate pyrophosphatase